MTMMMSAVKYAAVRQLSVLWAGFGALGIYVAILVWGPALERQWPVVHWQGISDFRRVDESTIEIQYSFRKLRNCRFIGLSWFVGDPDKDFERVSIRLSEGDTVLENRPVGFQRSYHHDVRIPAPLQDLPHFGILSHHCGWPWTTETVLGPFPSWFRSPPFPKRPNASDPPDAAPPARVLRKSFVEYDLTHRHGGAPWN
jgi:hypothetical protein